RDAAGATWTTGCLPLPSLGIALARYLDSPDCGLSAHTSSGVSSGLAAGLWPRESAQRARSRAHGLQSHQRRGPGIRGDSFARALSPSRSDSRWWRSYGVVADAAR